MTDGGKIAVAVSLIALVIVGGIVYFQHPQTIIGGGGLSNCSPTTRGSYGYVCSTDLAISSSWTVYQSGANILAAKGTGGGNSFIETSLNAAVADVIANNERITVRAGVYSLTSKILLTGNNVTLDLEPGVEIDIPNNAGWTVTDNNAGHTVIPAILIQSATNVRITGGLVNNLFVSSVQPTVGVMAGGNANSLFIDHVTGENMGLFAFYITGFSGGVTGGFSNIHVSEFVCINNGNTNDGGCVKVQNTSNPAVNVGRVWIQNGYVQNTVFYGFDIGATQASGISILDNEVIGNNAAPAIFIEGLSNNFVKIDGNRITGGLNGIKVQSPATNIAIVNDLVESAFQDGVLLTEGTATGGGWLVTSNIIRNNGQKTPGGGFAGILLAQFSGSSGNIGNVTMVSNLSTDTQATKSQSYGIYLFDNSGLNIDHVVIEANNLCGNNNLPLNYAFASGLFSNFNIQNNACYNPINKVTNFVTGSRFAPWGASATVVASTDYLADGDSFYLTSSAGTGVSITVKDGAGSTIYAPGATLAVPFYVPFGDKVNFGAFSVAPTVTVWFA